jgi:hypothetical protein
MDGSSRLVDWPYGRQYPRSRAQRNRRSRFYDKESRQSYREWARRRSQYHHPRKAAAFREQMRLRHGGIGVGVADVSQLGLPPAGMFG